MPVIDRLSSELPAVRGLRNDLGRGVLNAMKAGIAAAQGPYVLVSMADGSDEPRGRRRMVALARRGADVVSASRYMAGGHQVGGPPLKRLMSRTAGLTLHWFAGVRTHDPTNNFKLYSRRFLDTVTIESTAGFELALELTVKATIARRRVAEVPDDVARPDRRREQLQAPEVAAALPALVSGGVRRRGCRRGAPRGRSLSDRAFGSRLSQRGSGCRRGSSPSTCSGSSRTGSRSASTPTTTSAAAIRPGWPAAIRG